jgi:hypothetical protein
VVWKRQSGNAQANRTEANRADANRTQASNSKSGGATQKVSPGITHRRTVGTALGIAQWLARGMMIGMTIEGVIDLTFGMTLIEARGIVLAHPTRTLPGTGLGHGSSLNRYR